MSYWRIYVVMVKPEWEKKFQPYVGTFGCVAAHETLKAAKNCLKSVRLEYPNAYIQKCGAIS